MSLNVPSPPRTIILSGLTERGSACRGVNACQELSVHRGRGAEAAEARTWAAVNSRSRGLSQNIREGCILEVERSRWGLISDQSIAWR
jgi:hypothetical protein